MVRVGAVNVECDPNFRLYMVTRLANPTYLPDASTMVNLVNFTITRQVGQAALHWLGLAWLERYGWVGGQLGGREHHNFS